MATICRVCRCDWLDIFIDWKQREEEKNVERERKVASARGLHDACDACDAGDASTRVPTNVLLFVCFMDLSLSAPVFLFFIFLSTPPFTSDSLDSPDSSDFSDSPRVSVRSVAAGGVQVRDAGDARGVRDARSVRDARDARDVDCGACNWISIGPL